jgi:hypothetical protein
MAFRLPLSRHLSRQWAVKIRDWERVEPPHVTILRRGRAWRWDLRSGEFMDTVPDPSDVPAAVLKVITANWERLRAAWDEMYPENPVDSKEDDDE